MKGKKYFKPLTKEQQDWQDFVTKGTNYQFLKNENTEI
jgi:hypothetical protein